MNVEIQECEPKVSQGGRSYYRFKTNLGWMSAFDKPIIKALKDKEGERVNLLIAIDDEKGFKNIRKILKSDQNELDDEDEAEEDSEEEMDEANEKPKAEVMKMKQPNPHATMWASYAKDIFLALITKADVAKIDISTEEVMNKSIALIKQARTAFE